MKWTAIPIAVALAVSLPQVCCGQSNDHKSEIEVMQMTPEQHVREYCAEFYRHGLLHREYVKLLDDSITRDGLKAVPMLVTVIDEFDPTTSRKSGGHKEDASYAAEVLLGSLDSDFRLRAYGEGRVAIDAVRRLGERMRGAHYDIAPDEGEHSRRLRYQTTLGILKDLEGNNEYDRAIRDTLKLRYQIELSDKDLIDFSNYLIAQDPRYPAWSEPDWYVDQDKLNDAGNPLQYRIVQNVEPFYRAYLKFKQQRH